MQALLGPTLHLLVAAAFAAVAVHQWRRRARHAHQTALRFFLVWWLALVVVELGAAVQGLLHVGNDGVAWHAAIEYVRAFAFSIGLWGLLTYVFHLWGAPERIWIGTGAYYGIYGGLALATLAWLDPVGVVHTDLGVRIVFGRALPSEWMHLIGALFLIPPLVAAIAILHVARIEAEPAIKRRALLVGAGLALWCLGTWLSLALSDGAAALVPLVMDALAGLLIVRAYQAIGVTRPVVFHRADAADAAADGRDA